MTFMHLSAPLRRWKSGSSQRTKSGLYIEGGGCRGRKLNEMEVWTDCLCYNFLIPSSFVLIYSSYYIYFLDSGKDSKLRSPRPSEIR